MGLNSLFSVVVYILLCLQQAEVPEDSDDNDPDEVFGFISMLNLTERKVTSSFCESYGHSCKVLTQSCGKLTLDAFRMGFIIMQ